MTLYNHQQNILEQSRDKWALFTGTGSGKTRIALYAAEGKTLVVTTKTVRDAKHWEEELKDIEPHVRDRIRVKVISKEDFKKWKFEHVDTLILDESHTMCGVSPATKYKNKQPVLKASQCYTRTQEFIHKYKPKKIFLLSATPVPQPFAVWGAGKLLGKTWSFNAWRQTFYVQYKHLWLPKRTAVTKKLLEEAIRELGVVGQLEDWFDVPKQTEEIVPVPVCDGYNEIRNELRLEHPNPVVYIGKLHQVEQNGTEKAKKVLELWKKHGKVAVFCKYTRQIDEMYAYLAPKLAQKGTLEILDGRTKDREKVLQTSILASSGVILIQSQVSAGYELPTFDHMVFASLSYSYVDYFQAKGRILRANNLKKNWYYFLIAGEIDKAIYKCVMIKKDFSELEYQEEQQPY